MSLQYYLYLVCLVSRGNSVKSITKNFYPFKEELSNSLVWMLICIYRTGVFVIITISGTKMIKRIADKIIIIGNT